MQAPRARSTPDLVPRHGGGLRQRLMGAEAEGSARPTTAREPRTSELAATVSAPAASTPGSAPWSLAVPKLRKRHLFPGWLLEPRRRAERPSSPGRLPVLSRRGLDPPGRRRREGHGHRGDLQSQVRAGQKPRTPWSRSSARGPSTPCPTPMSGLTPWCRRSARVAGWSTSRSVIATGVNTDGQQRSWALTSSPPRTGRAGRPSCAFLGGPGSLGGGPRRLRRPPGPESRRRGRPARGHLAAVPGPWRPQPAHQGAQGLQSHGVRLVRTIFEQPDQAQVFA